MSLKAMLEQFEENSIFSVENTLDGDDNDIDLTAPEDDNPDLQLDILNFISNNQYPEVKDIREFAASVGKSEDEVLRQILIMFTNFATIYSDEFNKTFPDAGDGTEWHPDGFDPENDLEAVEGNRDMLESAGLDPKKLSDKFS